MSTLRPEDRALFAAARHSFEPTDDDRARVGRALGLPVGAAMAAIAVTTTATSAAAAAPTVAAHAALPALPVGLSVGKWLAIVAFVAVVGGGGVVLAVSGRAPSTPASSPTVQIVTPLSGPSPAARAPVQAPPPAPVVLPPAILSPQPAPPPANVAHGTPRAEMPRAPSVEAPQRSVSVVEEARLLREAEAALQAGELARATRLLDEHARAFPGGVLAEERDAERVLLLCAQGAASAARVEAQRFLAAHPDSPLAGRVRASCAAL